MKKVNFTGNPDIKVTGTAHLHITERTDGTIGKADNRGDEKGMKGNDSIIFLIFTLFPMLFLSLAAEPSVSFPLVLSPCSGWLPETKSI